MKYDEARQECEDYVNSGEISREALFTLVGNIMVSYFGNKTPEEIVKLLERRGPTQFVEKYPDVAFGAAIAMMQITANGVCPAYLTDNNANGMLGMVISIAKGMAVKDKERQALNG